MCDSTLLEPKEEELDDFQLIPTENEIVAQSAAIMKEEVKEEPLGVFGFTPFVNQISNKSSLNENEYKKEELIDDEEVLNLNSTSSHVKDEPIVDEYIQDLVRLGQIPAWDAALDQSARYGILPAITMETKSEDSAVVDSLPLTFADDFKDESRLMSNNKRSSSNKGFTELAKKFRIDKSSYIAIHQQLKEELPPQCIFCEIHPVTVYAYIYHLIHRHKYSVISNKVRLFCSCGVEVRSHCQDPSHKCDGLKYTLHVLDDVPPTPQCVLCETYPPTAQGYVSHLNHGHQSSLIENGIYLLCSCGFEFRLSLNRLHNLKCDSHDFTLHKLSPPIERRMNKGTNQRTENASYPHHHAVQCVLCESNPATAYGYADHLRDKHNSTLIANGIYLRCWCGIEVRSCNRDFNHMKCSGRQFSLHKISER